MQLLALDLLEELGVSSLSLGGLPLEEAIGRVEGAGFGVFELVPYPYKRPCEFDRREREALARRLGRFHTVTVHSSHAGGLDLTSPDESVRARCLEEYSALLRFAADIGARVVSFHKMTPRFAETAARFSLETGVETAVESFDNRPLVLGPAPAPGVLFDVGHAAVRIPGHDNAEILRWIEDRLPDIREFHLHGVNPALPERKDHHEIDANNAVDYPGLVRHLAGKIWSGPLVMEIGIRREAWQANIEAACEARQALREGLGVS